VFLIEREFRQTMKRDRLKALPLYPGERHCARPTTEQVLWLFSHKERHLLRQSTPPQRRLLDLLGARKRFPGLTGRGKFPGITFAMHGKY
jgi:hypothetical protein